MKTKLISILCVAALAAIATVSPLAAAVGFVGFMFFNSFRSGYAYLTVVPGVMKVDGKEVPPMTRAEKALFDYLVTLQRGNQVTLDAVRSGAISFDPVSYFIRFNLTGLSGYQTILSSATIKALGVTNFPNGAQLQQYYNFCYDRIAIRAVITNTANTAVYNTVGYSNVMTAIDPAIRNGMLIVKSNKNTVVETPIVDFLSEAAVTGGGSRENAGGILEKPRFFLEQLENEVVVGLPQAVANTANTTTIIEVVFSGVQARLKY